MNDATAERYLASGGPTKQRFRRIAVDDRDRRRSAPFARGIVRLLFTIENLIHQYSEFHLRPEFTICANCDPNGVRFDAGSD